MTCDPPCDCACRRVQEDEIERLRAALKPFADRCDIYVPSGQIEGDEWREIVLAAQKALGVDEQSTRDRENST